MQEKSVLDDGPHQITGSDTCYCTDNAAGEAQESRFQAEKGVEIMLAIAGGFEHSDFDLTPPQEYLHGIDNAYATDEESQQADNTQEELNLIDFLLALFEQVLSGDNTHRRKSLTQLAF